MLRTRHGTGTSQSRYLDFQGMQTFRPRSQHNYPWSSELRLSSTSSMRSAPHINEFQASRRSWNIVKPVCASPTFRDHAKRNLRSLFRAPSRSLLQSWNIVDLFVLCARPRKGHGHYVPVFTVVTHARPLLSLSHQPYCKMLRQVHKPNISKFPCDRISIGYPLTNRHVESEASCKAPMHPIGQACHNMGPEALDNP